MNLLLIAEVLANLAFSVSAVMALPLGYALYHGEGWAAIVFCIAILIGITVGGSLKQYGKMEENADIPVREGVAITGLGWLTVNLIATMPYLVGGFLSPLDSLAEAISGLSGTGAAFIDNLDVLPRSVLLWRSLTNWLGGIGIIVIFMALLPQFGRGGMNMMKAESTGPSADRQLPRIRDNAVALFAVYMGFSLTAVAAYWLCGMDGYDALSHGLTTIATGGFSTFNNSFIHYDSPLLEGVASFFMLLASGSFGMYVLAFRGGSWRTVWKNTEYRAFLGLFAVATVLIIVDLMTELDWNFTKALRYTVFQTASLGSTTGYVSFDFDTWPSFSKGVLLLLMFMGGCAGSTSGGFKIIRLVILVKLVRAIVWQKLHPNMVATIRMNGEVVPGQIVFNVARHFFVYVMMDVIFSFFLIADGISMIDAVSVGVSTMGSVGPGFGIAGATSTYAILPPFSKAVACVSMFLGRLEIFTVMALFTPEFWYKGKGW